MPPVGFEPTISAGARPQTYALDRAAIGTGVIHTLAVKSGLNPPIQQRTSLLTSTSVLKGSLKAQTSGSRRGQASALPVVQRS